jgi:hypothetical protein
MDVLTAVAGVIATLITVASSQGNACVQSAAVCQSRRNTTCRNGALEPMQ